MMPLIAELTWRGMLQDIMPGTEEQLSREMTSGYIGFDPTADSLHIGSLVPILLLVHLQRAGHKPFALVGGATGMVGDPSGKNEERNLLSEVELNHNLKGIRVQLEKYLDFNQENPNAAELVNNFDWFREMHFLDFIRDIGKHLTVNYMMAKDSVKKRLEGVSGMSFTEFSYQLVQGYDFYWLYNNRNCKLQMGGSDQWGNITTGAELIRRKSGGEAFAFTCPLLTKSDGSKFGKTEKGNIWLDPQKTSPYQFYQFWLNAADEDAMKWIRIFTFLRQKEIQDLVDEHQKDPSGRLLQKALAREVTVFIHGQAEYELALVTTAKLFDQSGDVEKLDESDLHALEGIVKSTYPISEINGGVDLVRFLAETGILSSRGEARKMVLNGGIRINRNKVENLQFSVDAKSLLHEKYILVQKGKKNFYLVEVK
jgi:tyrosyl-tRNA synthetase